MGDRNEAGFFVTAIRSCVRSLHPPRICGEFLSFHSHLRCLCTSSTLFFCAPGNGISDAGAASLATAFASKDCSITRIFLGGVCCASMPLWEGSNREGLYCCCSQHVYHMYCIVAWRPPLFIVTFHTSTFIHILFLPCYSAHLN